MTICCHSLNQCKYTVKLAEVKRLCSNIQRETEEQSCSNLRENDVSHLVKFPQGTKCGEQTNACVWVQSGPAGVPASTRPGEPMGSAQEHSVKGGHRETGTKVAVSRPLCSGDQRDLRTGEAGREPAEYNHRSKNDSSSRVCSDTCVFSLETISS